MHCFEPTLPSSFRCHFSFSLINPCFSSGANGPCLTYTHRIYEWHFVMFVLCSSCCAISFCHQASQCEKTNRCQRTHRERPTWNAMWTYVQSIYHLICSPTNEMCAYLSTKVRKRARIMTKRTKTASNIECCPYKESICGAGFSDKRLSFFIHWSHSGVQF